MSEGRVDAWTDLTIGDSYRVEWQDGDYGFGGYFTSELAAINFYEVETHIVKSVEFANGVTITGDPHGMIITLVEGRG